MLGEGAEALVGMHLGVQDFKGIHMIWGLLCSLCVDIYTYMYISILYVNNFNFGEAAEPICKKSGKTRKIGSTETCVQNIKF